MLRVSVVQAILTGSNLSHQPASEKKSMPATNLVCNSGLFQDVTIRVRCHNCGCAGLQRSRSQKQVWKAPAEGAVWLPGVGPILLCKVRKDFTATGGF